MLDEGTMRPSGERISNLYFDHASYILFPVQLMNCWVYGSRRSLETRRGSG